MSSVSRSTTTLPTPTIETLHFDLRDNLAELCSHFQQCSQARSWKFRTAELGEQVHALVAPRLISTFTGVVLVLGLIALCS